MFALERWQEILDTIRRNKLRTLATAFGVFWGIFMLVLLMGAGQGLQNGVMSSVLLDATNSIWFFSEETSLPYRGTPPGKSIIMTENDVKAVEESIEGIEVISPENFLGGNYQISYKNRSGPFRVYGAEPDYFEIKVTQKIINGRDLNVSDEIEGRKVCVVGEKAAEVLFEPGQNPVGTYIRIRDVYFRVVGIFRFDSYMTQQAERVFIPLSTFQKTFNPDKSIDLFAVTTRSGFSGKSVEQDVVALLAQRHQVHPEDNQAFWTHNQEDEFQSFQNLFLGIKSFVWLVGIGTLLAGIVGVSNIMIILVKDRTREIGVRKSIGATPWSIISLILQESVVITSVAGYVGLLAGVLILEGLNTMMNSLGMNIQYFANPELNFSVAISAMIILVISGTLAGLFPAIRAARIKPVDALRAE
ncbi:MAG: ABC transporter permease [Bacteroidota bacterium]